MSDSWDDEDKINRLNKEIGDCTSRFNMVEVQLKAKEWEYHTLRRLIYNAIKYHDNDLTHVIKQNGELFDKVMKEASDRRVTDQSNAGNTLVNKINALRSNVRQIEQLGGNADAVKQEIENIIRQCQIIADSDPHNTELY